MSRSVSFRALTVTFAAALVAVAGPISASPALASNFGSTGTTGITGTTNGVWLTTSASFVVGRISLTSTYSSAVTTVMNGQYNPTDLNVSIASPTYCDSSLDTCIYDSDYGDNGLNGWNACDGPTSGSHPNMRCATQWVRINQQYNPPANRIVCHEVAHSVGLRHTSEQASCVKRTADGGNSSTLSTHDRGHLNATY